MPIVHGTESNWHILGFMPFPLCSSKMTSEEKALISGGWESILNPPPIKIHLCQEGGNKVY